LLVNKTIAVLCYLRLSRTSVSLSVLGLRSQEQLPPDAMQAARSSNAN
jgi:hypothetical protein